MSTVNEQIQEILLKRRSRLSKIQEVSKQCEELRKPLRETRDLITALRENASSD